MIAPLRERVLFRAGCERHLRAFFDARGYTEVSPPTIVPCPGMEPELRALQIRARSAVEIDGQFLHTSPELAIKATLADLGLDVFTLARCYRDEPPSDRHHSEFTMLEWYRRGASTAALMVEVEELVAALLPTPAGEPPLRFARLTVRDAFRRWAGVEPDAPVSALAAAAAPLGADATWGWDGLFTLLMVERVEPRLAALGPVFLTEYPAAAAALARLLPSDPRVAERFELYLPHDGAALEIANAFGELVDEGEQRRRFRADQEARRRAGEPEYPIPEHALSGIARMSDTAGIALGWERLLMWLASRRFGWRTRVADWLAGALMS